MFGEMRHSSPTSARSLGLPLCCSARPDPIPLTRGDGGPPKESPGEPIRRDTALFSVVTREVSSHPEGERGRREEFATFSSGGADVDV